MRLIFFSFLSIFTLTICATQVHAASTSKIKGKLEDPNYSILALDADGKGRSTTSASSGVFTSASDANSNVTLSLLSNGEYFGPVVLAIQSNNGKLYSLQTAKAQNICSATGARALTGLKFPAKTIKGKGGNLSLGVVKIDSEHGFAYITKKLSKKNLVLSSRSNVDENCTPSGAGGKLGLSSTSGQILGARAKAASDSDADSDGVDNKDDLDDDSDGISDPFDLDGDNDGTQDYNQNSSDSEDDGPDSGDEDEVLDYHLYLFTNFQLEFTKAYNMHSMSVSQELIDSRVTEYAGIAMGVVGNSEFEVELDGNGLSYMSVGGTGRVSNGPGGQNGQAFPDDFDPDGDGMGRIDELPALGNGFDVQMKPNAPTSEIKAGDVVSQVFIRDGREVRLPLMLEFIFHTTPTLTSIKLGENAPSETTVSYPIPENAPGTPTNCFTYNAASQGHLLTFTVERPQRPGITEAGESEFMDMGNLRYVVSASGNTPGSVGFCPVSSFSTSDANLTLYSEQGGQGGEEGVLDHKGDTPFNATQSNALTFTLDLRDCTGQTTGTHNLTIKARTPRNDNSGQGFCVTRQ